MREPDCVDVLFWLEWRPSVTAMNDAKKTNGGAEAGIPEKGITVELSYASVAAFDDMVAVARKHPTFQQFGEGRSTRVRVTYQLEELEALQEMKEAAWELRKKRAWLDGEEIEWYEMARMTYCFRELLRKPRLDHCFFDLNFWSGFGCRYAIANLSDRINNEWLGFGRLEEGGAWVFDKPRIAEHVKKNLPRAYQHCPAYDAEYLETFLEIFPERIDPAEDDRWTHLRDRGNNIIGVGPPDVDSAKKIVHELRVKVRARRGTENVQENGKRPVPLEFLRQYQAPKKKKGLLARLVG